MSSTHSKGGKGGHGKGVHGKGHSKTQPHAPKQPNAPSSAASQSKKAGKLNAIANPPASTPHAPKQPNAPSSAASQSKKAGKLNAIANPHASTPHAAAYQGLYSLGELQTPFASASGKGKGKVPVANVPFGVANKINLAEQAKLLNMFSKKKAAQNKAKAKADAAKAQAPSSKPAASDKGKGKVPVANVPFGVANNINLAEQVKLLNMFSNQKAAQNKAKAKADAAKALAQAQAQAAKAQAATLPALASVTQSAKPKHIGLRPITIEAQESLKCGQHTLNNLLQNDKVKFVSDFKKLGVLIPQPGCINLMHYCDKFKHLDLLPSELCNFKTGYYDITILQHALRQLGINSDFMNLDMLSPNKLPEFTKLIRNPKLIGFIVNKPGHWYAVVNRLPADVHDVEGINGKDKVLVIDSQNANYIPLDIPNLVAYLNGSLAIYPVLYP